MMIYIDADACPVTKIAESIARRHSIPVTLLCDTNHVLTSDYSVIRVIGAGADAVDIALINLCQRGDIVITQDYGVAALALGKGARAIHQNGRWYTDKNIDSLLMERYLKGISFQTLTDSEGGIFPVFPKRKNRDLAKCQIAARSHSSLFDFPILFG